MRNFEGIELIMIKKILKKLSDFQYQHNKLIILVSFFITVFMLVGASKIYMQSDITKEFPQDLPIFILNEKISLLYGTSDTIFATIKIDLDYNEKGGIIDIRDPKVIETLQSFENLLLDMSEVDSITSVNLLFKNMPKFNSIDEVKGVLDQYSDIKMMYNKDYTATLMIISASVGTDTKKIENLIERIDEKKKNTLLHPGLKITVTGMPFILNLIMDYLWEDAIFTTLLAAIVIFFLLIIIERSLLKAMLIFIPLMLGLIWTLGTLGWLNIPISVATVGVGAMILGLGVEYGVFIVSRYIEERKKYDMRKAINITMSEVGASITGSGFTTIIGFLALVLSIMPMMQHLGESLALGIFFSLVAALIINPAFIITEERLNLRIKSYLKKKLKEK